MNAIEELAHSVDEAASLRNHEVIAAVIMRSEYDICCCYGKVFSHMRALERRIHKLNIRISQAQGSGYSYARRFVTACEYAARLVELEHQKEELTKELEDDRRLFNNLVRCGKCPACKFVPQMVALADTFSPVLHDVRDIFTAEGGEGE